MQQPQYAPLLHEVVQRLADAPLDDPMDRPLVRFGCEILAVVPGRVSTEVDALACRLTPTPPSPAPSA